MIPSCTRLYNHGGRAVWVVCGLCAAAGVAMASLQEFQITRASLDDSDRPRIEFPANTNSYYILLSGETLNQIATPAAMVKGADGQGVLLDPSPLAAPAGDRFYRVKQVPIDEAFDTDGDGIDDYWELNHSEPPVSLNPLFPGDAGLDPDGNGLSHYQEYLAAILPPTALTESSPANGESGVAVTRETIFRFSEPLAATTVLDAGRIMATFGGRQLLSRIDLASDRKTVTLFYLEPLPASARVRVTFFGAGLKDEYGRSLDLDGDGQPGGDAVVDFDTYSTTPVPATAVIGHVYASDPIPDGQGGFTNRPLPGVRITVDGAEQELFAVTDLQGSFKLEPCPAGRFFVKIDGHTSPLSQWPNGDYYPTVGKAWEAVAGRTNNLAGGSGQIFLPLVTATTLTPVSAIAPTVVTFPGDVLQSHPDLAGVSITVPPNTLFSDDGTRGGRVGIAPVPPDRLPEPLPQGLEFPLVITIQTDGPSNFGVPVPVRFPNLPDPVSGVPLPAGGKSALWSFNHDKGHWELQGPMTVSADGDYVETDPGVGVRQPGWHGTMPGSPGTGGPIKKNKCAGQFIGACQECRNGSVVKKPDGQISQWTRSQAFTIRNPTCSDLNGTLLGVKTIRWWRLVSSQQVGLGAPGVGGGCQYCLCHWRLILITTVEECLHEVTEEAYFCENGNQVRRTRIVPVIDELTVQSWPVLQPQGTVPTRAPCTGTGCGCAIPPAWSMDGEDRVIGN